MTNPLDTFQTLLRELFQFDCADLDFGIYRIMNYKRGVIGKFITQDLPGAVAAELDRGALADEAQAAKELAEVANQITESLGKDAIDADGNLAETYHGTPLGKRYQDLRAKATKERGREAREASIFNHLYAFFSRYYQDGDFISKRRYSKRQRYAIPYNGEEVYLYWANNDQYYVKTAEHFHDYNFTSHGVTAHFKLQAASVEQNNVKGDKRFFLPRTRETDWDEKTARVVIPFEYRPLTEREEIAYGKKNQQDAIIAEARTQIPRQLRTAERALAALTALRPKSADGEPVTFLEHHLRQYTRRNTSDFFIHKDLKGFLSRELDFYLKNEVLNLDEMETAGEDLADAWFQLMRVIKAVGGRIIDFLDQIESFQRMLWEKRKFITETQYSETLLNVEKLARPFSYNLHIHADGQTPEKIADVPETFNYLLGLHVQTRKVYHDGDRRYLVYRGRIDHRQVAVIWRETEGWQKANLERDKRFVAEQKLSEGADEVFVNGDSFIPNATALEPVFKGRMFAPVEA